jgi:hypothetical protein
VLKQIFKHTLKTLVLGSNRTIARGKYHRASLVRRLGQLEHLALDPLVDVLLAIRTATAFGNLNANPSIVEVPAQLRAFRMQTRCRKALLPLPIPLSERPQVPSMQPHSLLGHVTVLHPRDFLS